jgi:hypothetical protein
VGNNLYDPVLSTLFAQALRLNGEGTEMTGGMDGHHGGIHTLSSKEMVASVRSAHQNDPRMFNRPIGFQAKYVLDIFFHLSTDAFIVLNR